MNSRVCFGSFCAAQSLAITLLLSLAIASAAPIGVSVGPGPSTTSTFNRAGTGWVVDDGSFPAAFGTQEVFYDPTAGPWHKVLASSTGGDFGATDSDLPLSVTEFITIGGTTPWTDWHERIATVGWRWVDDRAGSGEPSFTFASGAAVPGLGVAFTPASSTSGGQLDFTFAPLPPGTHLKITKRLTYDGLDPLLPGELFLGKIDLFQHPTVPEPSGALIAVLAIAVAAIAVRFVR